MTYDTDLNDSGRTDAWDLARVRMSFGTADPIADVNKSGKVDAVDIAIVQRDMFREPVGTPKWDVEEEAAFAALNWYRANPSMWQPYLVDNVLTEPDRSRVLQPLRRSYRLSQAAQWMAQWCCDQLAEDPHFLSHQDDVYADMGARVVAFFPEARRGYTAEVALGTDGGGPAASGYHSIVRWSLSPGHNGALLGDYVSVGFGHAIAPDGQHRWYGDFSTIVDTAPGL